MEKGEALATIYANSENKARQASIDLMQAYEFSQNEVVKPKSILGIVK